MVVQYITRNMAGTQGEHHFAQKKPCSDLKSQRAKGSVTVSKTDSKDLNDSTVSFFLFQALLFCYLFWPKHYSALYLRNLVFIE